MISASNPRRIGAAFGLTSAGLKRPLQRKAKRLLDKGKPAPGPEHRLGELKQDRADSSLLSETIRLALQGFEIICQQHCRRVYAVCLRMLRDPVETEDLVQEVFIQLLRKVYTFRGKSAFSTWLHRFDGEPCSDAPAQEEADITRRHHRKRREGQHAPAKKSAGPIHG